MAKPRIVITMGDPCGIGPEVVAKALAAEEVYSLCSPAVIGAGGILQEALRLTGSGSDVSVEVVLDTLKFSETPAKLFCFDSGSALLRPRWGEVCAEGGSAAMRYIELAARFAKAGQVDAVVTAPINKVSLKLAKAPYLDHTEAFAALTGVKSSMTLFVSGGLRIFFHTRHIPLKEVSSALRKDQIVESLAKCHRYLDQLGVEAPHVALAALNPHAGEGGLFSNEEDLILTPAVAEAKSRGLRVSGPVPADSVFHQANAGIYDAVLALYHDQGHIAAKTLDFYGTVSMTMGLPFLRTSVDHGTAMDIAGKGIANERSLVEAIKVAARHAMRVKDSVQPHSLY